MALLSFLSDISAKKTGIAFLCSKLFKTPFWAIFSLLPVILYKDLHATPFQIALMVALKPTASILSFYWSEAMRKRPDRLQNNLIFSSILGFLPFFLFPFVENVWFYIASFGFYMVIHRGVMPSWMELLKRNIPDRSREKVFAYSSLLGYIGDALWPFLIGTLMDQHTQIWRWIFPVVSLISLLPVFFQYRIPLNLSDKNPSDLVSKSAFSGLSLFLPWKEAFALLLRRPDFFKFQIGFMLGGGGLMIANTALPAFFVDVLNVSYKELAIGITLCKALGFAITTPTWTNKMHHTEIFRVSSYVFASAALFPLLIYSSQWHFSIFYLGYLCYGMMQAGSELTWNLSGPKFSGNEDSARYSSVNILTTGIRGCILPFFGAILCTYGGVATTMIFSSTLCLIGSWIAIQSSPSEKTATS